MDKWNVPEAHLRIEAKAKLENDQDYKELEAYYSFLKSCESANLQVALSGVDPTQVHVRCFTPGGKELQSGVLFAAPGEPLSVVFDIQPLNANAPELEKPGERRISGNEARKRVDMARNAIEHYDVIIYVLKGRDPSPESWLPESGIIWETRNFEKANWRFTNLAQFRQLWNSSQGSLAGRTLVNTLQHGSHFHRPLNPETKRYLGNEGSPMALHKATAYINVPEPTEKIKQRVRDELSLLSERFNENNNRLSELRRQLREAEKIQPKRQRDVRKRDLQNKLSAAEKDLAVLGAKIRPLQYMVETDEYNAYEFQIGSKGLSILNVDSKEVVTWRDIYPPEKLDSNVYQGLARGGVANLRPGKHKLEYHAVSYNNQLLTVVGWKPPAAKQLYALKASQDNQVIAGCADFTARQIEQRDAKQGLSAFDWSVEGDTRMESADDLILMSFRSVGQEIDGASYQWSFDDGQQATGRDVTHVWMMPGMRQVTLQVMKEGQVIADREEIVHVHQDWGSSTLVPLDVFHAHLMQMEPIRYSLEELIHALRFLEAADPDGVRLTELHRHLHKGFSAKTDEIGPEHIDKMMILVRRLMMPRFNNTALCSTLLEHLTSMMPERHRHLSECLHLWADIAIRMQHEPAKGIAILESHKGAWREKYIIPNLLLRYEAALIEERLDDIDALQAEIFKTSELTRRTRNLAENPLFEDLDSDGRPFGVSLQGIRGRRRALADRSTKQSGTQSLRVDFSSGSGGPVLLSDTYSGIKYKAKFWMKTELTGFKNDVEIMAGGETAHKVPLQSPWTPYVVSFKQQSGQAPIYIQAGHRYSIGNGSIWIDNLEIYLDGDPQKARYIASTQHAANLRRIHSMLKDPENEDQILHVQSMIEDTLKRRPSIYLEPRFYLLKIDMLLKLKAYEQALAMIEPRLQLPMSDLDRQRLYQAHVTALTGEVELTRARASLKKFKERYPHSPYLPLATETLRKNTYLFAEGNDDWTIVDSTATHNVETVDRRIEPFVSNRILLKLIGKRNSYNDLEEINIPEIVLYSGDTQIPLTTDRIKIHSDTDRPIRNVKYGIDKLIDGKDWTHCTLSGRQLAIEIGVSSNLQIDRWQVFNTGKKNRLQSVTLLRKPELN
ncbi:MAG: PKD domain-containing protein [Verrucomicrobiota bacterium]